MNRELGYRTPMSAIRAKCLDCCCDSANEVRLCSSTDCPLHPYRLGHSPYRAKRKLSEAQRANLAKMLANRRKKS